MIIKLFKGQQPLAFIVLPLFILVIWLFSGFHYFTIAADNGMPLYSLVASVVKKWPSWLLAIAGFLIIGSQCLHLNLILNKYEVLYKVSYLPALIYFVLSAFLPQFVVFHPMLFVNSFMLFVLERIMRLYKNPAPLAVDFDSCLLISLASLFYLPALIFCLLFFVSLGILKPFSWRDWIVGLMGLILPYFFLFVFCFLDDRMYIFTDMISRSPLPQAIRINNILPKGYQVTMVVISLLFITTLVHLRNNFYKNDIRTRNYQQVIIVYILTSIACALITTENMLFKLSVIAIPFSVVVSNYFLSFRKNWMAESLFLILLGTMIFNYIISF